MMHRGDLRLGRLDLRMVVDRNLNLTQRRLDKWLLKQGGGDGHLNLATDKMLLLLKLLLIMQELLLMQLSHSGSLGLELLDSLNDFYSM